jgi:NAD(P)-dependent dehydrogenase (short-subunit alcohol dehydrogenase family)
VTDDQRAPGERRQGGVLDLTGRVVVVTGGNGGIGLGLAHGVARAGATVAVWGRDEPKNRRAAAELTEAGHEAVAFGCDVTDEEQVVDTFARTVAELGRVDTFFANAGITGNAARFVDMTLEEWRRVFRVNVDGTFLCLREAARHMVARGEGGALVAVSSIASRYGAPRKEHYAASKTALGSLVQSLAVELAGHGIRCNTLAPGWVETDLIGPDSAFAGRDHERFRSATVDRTPVQRWGRPDDLGEVAAFLADPTLVFHTGDTVVVDGGYSVC